MYNTDYDFDVCISIVRHINRCVLSNACCVFQILVFFTARLEQNGKNISPAEVLEVINEGAMQFRKDRLKVTA